MKILISKLFVITFFIFGGSGLAQHDHHQMEADTSSMKVDSTISQDPSSQDRGMNHHSHNMTMPMNGGVFINDAMSQEGSGTSWQPVSSTMHMSMFHSGSWMMMLHGSIVPRYTVQGGLRGDKEFGAPNWLMFSAQNKLNKTSQFMFRSMVSIDRITEDGDGYPLLFQTGETWKGKHLVDRQHPHDLFSELSVAFSTKFSNSSGGYIYFGYPGEPAIGPPAFMHRPSAFSNPDAPLSHHWQDATHITFGVATAGVAYKNFKVEGSYFNGTEPDEDRYNFDKMKFDSYSGRIFFNPTNDFSLQASAGFLKDPEAEGLDVVRRSASILYSKKFKKGSNLSASFIWGQNKDDFAGAQNSYLFEAEYYFLKNFVYTRLEAVQKTRHELGIEIDETKKELIGAYTLGYKRKLVSFYGMNLNAGAQGTIYSFDKFLTTYYGNSPASYQIYISLTP